jgi:hypothetical protein
VTVVGTLYDELGVSPGASQADLRLAYRQQARRRHPDVHPDHEADAEESMRRLNSAWSVLGDPEARRRYDERLAVGPPPPTAAGAGADGDDSSEPMDPFVTRPGHRLRPTFWALVLVVLAALFVVTAYAGDQASNPGPGTNATEPRCLTSVPGLEAYVLCDQPNVGRLVTEVAPDVACPPGTFRHLLVSRNRVACLIRA